jgi:hypothetical protein
LRWSDAEGQGNSDQGISFRRAFNRREKREHALAACKVMAG